MIWQIKARKIIGNLIVAYILFPIIYIHQYLDNIVSGQYHYYNIHFDTLSAYLKQIFNGFFLFSTLLIVASLLPFQLIKNKWLYRLDKAYFLITLCCYVLLNCLVVIISGWGALLLNASSPWFENISFIVVLVGFSFLIQVFLYILVDKYIRKTAVKIKAGVCTEK